MQIGELRQYILKSRGQDFTVDAEIIGINGRDIRIKYRSPKGSWHIRALRSAQDRARLVDYQVTRPGAPDGNQNAAKENGHRIAFTISFSGERLEKASQVLELQRREVTTETLRHLTYGAIEIYLDERE